jgi:hypothetical protein
MDDFPDRGIWVSARIREESRDILDGLRAATGCRTISDTLNAVIRAAAEPEGFAALSAFVASRGLAARPRPRRLPREAGEALGPLPRPVAPPAAAPVAAPTVEDSWDADFTGY